MFALIGKSNALLKYIALVLVITIEGINNSLDHTPLSIFATQEKKLNLPPPPIALMKNFMHAFLSKHL